MSYSEENGQITLKIDDTTFSRLVMTLAIATAYAGRDRNLSRVASVLRLLNTLHEGRADYTPYILVDEPVSLDELADHLSSLLTQLRSRQPVEIPPPQ